MPVKISKISQDEGVPFDRTTMQGERRQNHDEIEAERIGEA